MLETAVSAEPVPGSGASWCPLHRAALYLAVALDRAAHLSTPAARSRSAPAEPVFAAFFLRASPRSGVSKPVGRIDQVGIAVILVLVEGMPPIGLALG